MTYKNLTLAEHTALLNKMHKAYMPPEERSGVSGIARGEKLLTI